jgi:hypothetical protein
MLAMTMVTTLAAAAEEARRAARGARGERGTAARGERGAARGARGDRGTRRSSEQTGASACHPHQKKGTTNSETWTDVKAKLENLGVSTGYGHTHMHVAKNYPESVPVLFAELK